MAKGWASGALVDATNRLVVSNHHALKEADRARALFPTFQDGRLISDFSTVMRMLKDKTGDVLRADVVYRDAQRDLALLRLDKLPSEARPLMLAATGAATGHPVHTLAARPVGEIDAFWNFLSGTVAQPVHEEQWTYADRQGCNARVLVTKLPVSAGNSGGPIVNDRGELVAVHGGGDQPNASVPWGIDIGEIKTALEAYARATDIKLALEEGVGPMTQGPAASLTDLIRDLSEKDPQVRVHALVAMSELGPAARPALPALVKATNDKEEVVRRHALDVLEKIGTPAVSDLPVLIEALRDPNMDLRLYAVRALGKMGAAAHDAAPALQEVLKDTHLPLRRQA
jgi:S1-C subfamily serine protease